MLCRLPSWQPAGGGPRDKLPHALHHPHPPTALRLCVDAPHDSLAREPGLSGCALGKLCDRYDIPVLPRG